MPDPFFSVVIPTCNRDDMLRRALDSLQAQSFTDFEVVVVDNAGSSALAAEFEESPDSAIRFFRFTARRGAAAARNHGIEAAHGEFVCFLDDDDEYFPEMLARVKTFVCAPENQPLDFCWCGIEKRVVSGGELQRISNYQVSAASVEDRSYVLRIGTGSGFCASREALEAVGGFEEQMRVSEDRDLVLKLLENGYSGKPLNEILHRRYYHDGERLSSSQSAAEDARHDRMLLDRHDAYLRRFPALRNKLLDQLGQNYRLAGEISQACTVAVQAWRESPLRLKAVRRLLVYTVLRLTSGSTVARGSR